MASFTHTPAHLAAKRQTVQPTAISLTPPPFLFKERDTSLGGSLTSPPFLFKERDTSLGDSLTSQYKVHKIGEGLK